jgi:hypothetical protein
MKSHRTLTLSLWRDYRDQARQLAGMHLGTAVISEGADTAARELYRSGVRRAELVSVADLSVDAEPESAVRTLDLIRELTAWGIVVEWRVRMTGADESWPEFGHLYPPCEIEDSDDAVNARAVWARSFFLGKCHYRRGPGFIEVRDHRPGVLNRIVIDDPAYLAALSAVLDDSRARAVPEKIMRAFAAESLVLRFGDLHWWAPYRSYRWPHPPFLV